MTDEQTVAAAYVAPEILDYGKVADLTGTDAAGPNFDGGGGANIYAS